MADDVAQPAISLRPVEARDRDFLFGVYATTRADELALVPWPDAQKAAFLEQQFHAQDVAYRGAYDQAEFLVVGVSGRDAGRLYLAQVDGALHVIDVALLPEYRGQGIGTRLLQSIIDRADHNGVAVTLHVEPWNRARGLYVRLGFETVEQRGIYEFMRRPPRTIS